MTASLAFPGSRTLAGWWRQLASWQPQALWVGHLLLHRVEALVRLTRPARPDPLHLLVLKAVDAVPDQLDERLHLGPQVLCQALRALEQQGLAEPQGGTWTPTARGRQALHNGEYPRTCHERRVFYFVAEEAADRPPQFINLETQATVAWPAADGWIFGPQVLAACVGRPADWKVAHGFPIEVEQAVGVDDAPEAWRGVVLDRPERLVVALLQIAGGDRLLGFAVRQDGWALQSEAPAFSLGTDWRAVLPALSEAPTAENWDSAWRMWCQPRNLGPAVGEVSGLRLEGYRLHVEASPRLMERLRATRSDALKGEAWVLAGSGRLRTAALLEVVEAGPAPALRQA